MDLLRPFTGADRVLAAHGPALPQPDQLCGPFSAWVALHALLPEPPPVVALAAAAGTRVWPHDVASWRPPGAPLDTTGWSSLPAAASAAASGTDAAGLARAIASLTDLSVVPAAGNTGGVATLLAGLVELGLPVGVLANVRTGALGLAWDVGHFVVLHGFGSPGVGVADTYRELGAPDQPPGCRVVSVAALSDSLVDRGLLVLVAPSGADDVRALVDRAGLVREVRST